VICLPTVIQLTTLELLIKLMPQIIMLLLS